MIRNEKINTAGKVFVIWITIFIVTFIVGLASEYCDWQIVGFIGETARLICAWWLAAALFGGTTFIVVYGLASVIKILRSLRPGAIEKNNNLAGRQGYTRPSPTSSPNFAMGYLGYKAFGPVGGLIGLNYNTSPENLNTNTSSPEGVKLNICMSAVETDNGRRMISQSMYDEQMKMIENSVPEYETEALASLKDQFDRELMFRQVEVVPDNEYMRVLREEA